MTDNSEAMVLGSMVADSLALGVHWVYNTNVIDRKYGRVEELIAPELASFHRGRAKGDFTHYGDQALVLLESLDPEGRFNLGHFADCWKALFHDYDGYVDKATQATLTAFDQGAGPADAGSDSTDLGGAARIAPLVYIYRHDLDGMLAAVRAQTAMTHNNPLVVAWAEYFARVARRVLDGGKPLETLESVASQHFSGGPIAAGVADGLDSAGMDTRKAVKDFGQMCEVDAAGPAAVHLIATYPENFKQALVENIMAGGDSAARGMMVGMVLGAYQGMAAIPPSWLAELKARDRIVELLT